MPGSRLLSSLVLSMALVFAVAGCATNTEGESGSLSLELVINGDAEIDEVQWSITRGGEEIKSGTINTSANGATASVQAYGLEPGDGYTITLEAVSPEKETTCKGSAMFDIKVGEVTEVDVMMNCKPPRRFGAVRVNGELNICPYINWADVSPLETSVGNDIDLFAMATDDEGDPIFYMWSSGSGVIADPIAQSTTYTCTAVGDDAITILVTDDGGTHCMDMHTVPIECFAGDGEPCEGVICEDTGNECTTAACNSGTGFCETSNVADNTDCDGGAGMCMGGECVPKELCMDVVCEDDGNECTDEACNPADGMCETSNNSNACNDDTGTCSEGVCVPNPECTVDGDCPATGNECIDAACNAGTCGTSNNTNACDGGDGTCDAGVCVPNPECAVDGDCPATGNECIDPVCNAGTCETSNNTNACDDDTGTCQDGQCVTTDPCAGVVCDDTGNDCTVAECNPANGLCEESNVADETACNNDGGKCNAGFCVPAPTANGFIKTLDPNAGFSVSASNTQDTTNLPDSWGGFTLPLVITQDLVGHILQFGFQTNASNFDNTNNFYDNVVLNDPAVLYTQDFNGLDITASTVGDGWAFFVNVFDSAGTRKFGYGGAAPNGTGFISGIVSGQGGLEQEPQQLSVFSDYNCCGLGGTNEEGHGNGTDLVETNVFQERTIAAEDVGKTFEFIFQAKAGNIGQ
ncbi:MAG: hypothetical protein OES69_07370 [Myxococcales bacterium]|nr:hypothetical protein [Myxococcales bacterium]MDH3843742.1 hypothetical protein [Myxococcales bacterium]